MKFEKNLFTLFLRIILIFIFFIFVNILLFSFFIKDNQKIINWNLIALSFSIYIKFFSCWIMI